MKKNGHSLQQTGLLQWLYNNANSNFHETKVGQRFNHLPKCALVHAFSCSNECENRYLKKGREELVSSVVYVATSVIQVSQESEKQKSVKQIMNDLDARDIDLISSSNDSITLQFALADDQVKIFEDNGCCLNNMNHLDLIHVRSNPSAKDAMTEIKKINDEYSTTFNENKKEARILSHLPFKAQILNRNKGHSHISFSQLFNLVEQLQNGSIRSQIQQQLLSSPSFLYKQEFINHSHLNLGNELGLGKPDEETPTHKPDEEVRDEETPTCLVGPRKGKNLQALQQSTTAPVSEPVRRSKRKHPGMSSGSVSTSRVAGCRVDNNSSAELPTTNPESLEFPLRSTAVQWDCAFVNPFNTFKLLDHSEILSKLGTRMNPLVGHLGMLKYAMDNAGYTTSRVLKGITFDALDEFIQFASAPIFLTIESSYTGHCVKYKHIIGVIPVIKEQLKGQHHSHIVDGSYGLKTFPFTENNLIWCCGGCTSARISEFVGFIPGRKLAERDGLTKTSREQLVAFMEGLKVLMGSKKGELVIDGNR